ncbi:MAG: ABC transporter permease, partial [Actinomycetota bacterium]|nr:ABC transporter permease [Actinomycetota bacterium]
TVSLALLLPLAVSTAAADAIAGESQHGTLRALLLSPVGRLRLAAMKAFGVLVVAAACVLVTAVVGVLAGWVVVGTPGSMITLSGTTIGAGEAIGRVALAALWTVGQLAAVGAVALAISSSTEPPLVVLASVLGGLIAFGVAGAIPALDWLQPYLLTSGWSAGADVLRDPLPLDGLGSSSLVALVYLLVGGALLVVRMQRRDA